MSDTIADVDLTVLDQLEFSPRCQAPFHDDAGKGCQPEQEATHLVIAPCCGPRITVCAGRAHYLAHVACFINCSSCQRVTPNTWWTILSLDSAA